MALKAQQPIANPLHIQLASMLSRQDPSIWDSEMSITGEKHHHKYQMSKSLH